MNKFETGQVLVTRTIAELIKADKDFEKFINTSFDRYLKCDWGSMDKSDKKLNDIAVKNGDERIHAAYIDSTGRKIWIITEWDRSVTTILFSTEY